MKSSFWHPWWQSSHSPPPNPPPRGGGGKGRRGAARFRWRPRLEALEDRMVPSGAPHLVRDIFNSTTLASYPTDIAAVGSTTYFVADDQIHGRELWKTDGT